MSYLLARALAEYWEARHRLGEAEADAIEEAMDRLEDGSPLGRLYRRLCHTQYGTPERAAAEAEYRAALDLPPLSEGEQHA